jgi:hypothetical protein
MGGSVGVASTFGQGRTFTIVVPRAADVSPACEAGPAYSAGA